MIFVTGGSGLVGAHVLLMLLQQAKKVKALKREFSSLDLCKKIFNYYKEEKLFDEINWVEGDVNDVPSLQEGMKGCDFLFHCAGLVSFVKADMHLLQKVNIEGTSNVMNIALAESIKKAGFVSSISALGRNSTVGIINEECYFQATNFDSNYSHSKYFSEQEVWRASAEGLDVVIVNPSIILGPGDWTKGSSQIFQKIYRGLKFYAPGSTGYVDVYDVAEALIQLVFSDVKNQRFIVSAANLKYRDCFNRIAIALRRPKAHIKVTPFLKEIAWRFEAVKSFLTGSRPLVTKETAISAMRSHSYSTQKIKNTLGFKFIDIDVTIKKYADWFIADQE